MSLPLRLKTQVRDIWEKEDGDIQTAFKKLQKLIGRPIRCEPEWPLLWNLLKSGFPDQALFIPTVASSVEAWIDAFEEVAEDESNEAWLEQMLEGINASLNLVLAAADGKPATKWLANENAFEICFPKSEASPHNFANALVSAFHAGLLDAFKPTKEKKSASSAAAATDVDAGPSDVGSGVPTTMTAMPLGFNKPSSVNVTRFPQLNMIARPEEVVGQPPYYIVVTRSSRMFSVECSHQPGLEIMGEYLKKWVKKNHNLSSKPPMVHIEMRSAIFGLSTMYDHLEVTVPDGDRWTTLSPMLILSFITTVLGYTLVFQDGNGWHFARHTAYK